MLKPAVELGVNELMDFSRRHFVDIDGVNNPYYQKADDCNEDERGKVKVNFAQPQFFDFR